MREERVLDFLIGSAFHGGVETVICRLLPVLRECGFQIRIVQMIWRGRSWAPKEAEFHCICMDEKKISYELFVQGYRDYLSSHRAPDMVLAINWPLLCQVARQVVLDLSLTCPVASWLHGTLGVLPDAPLEKEIDELTYADFHIVINRGLASLLLEHLPDAEVYVVHNPMDPIESRDEERSFDPRKLVCIGRFGHEKNLPLVFQALSLLKPRWKLELIGDGEECPIDVWLEGLGISDLVSVRGWTEYPWETVNDAAALVISSQHEGGPLVAIEALGRGIPVISTPVGMIPDIIEPGINGFVYPSDEPAELAKILLLIEKGILKWPDAGNCKRSVRFFCNLIPLRDFVGKIEVRLSHIEIAEKVVRTGNACCYFTDEWGSEKELAKHSLIAVCYNLDGRIDELMNEVNSMGEIDEVILVDNASMDHTLVELSSSACKIKQPSLVIGLENHLTFASARNIGLGYATGESVSELSFGQE